MSHTLTPYLVDTHAHINFPALAADFEGVIERAHTNGVQKIVAVGDDVKTNNQVFTLASKNDFIWATVGMHPSYIGKNESDNKQLIINQLKEQADFPRVVAIGEIGLDYHDNGDQDGQKEFFDICMKLSIEKDLPVVIHSRDAFEDTFSIMASYKGKAKGVLHCFTGGIKEAKAAIDLGYLIGITGIITFNRSEKIAEAIKYVGLKNILLETDCPFLAPVPFRGKVNEPANVLCVARKVSEILNKPLEEVMKVTSENANKLFKLDS